MSSSNKTANLGLNSWLGSDKPSRADFNSDNEIIDGYFNQHSTDMEMHLSESDRERLLEPYYVGTYFGDGETSRTIEAECSFNPTFGIIFCLNYPLGVNQYDAKVHNNYTAIMSVRGGTLGAKLSGKKIIIAHAGAEATINSEKSMLNLMGLTYCYILFR